MDVYARRLSELEDKLICSFRLAANVIGSGIQKFINDMDGPTFLKGNV